MIMPNRFDKHFSYNTSYDINCNHNQNNLSNQRPNLDNIPLKSLKEFPFTLPPQKEKVANRYEFKTNNTFVETNFDKLSSSFNAMDVSNYKHRKKKYENPQKFNNYV